MGGSQRFFLSLLFLKNDELKITYIPKGIFWGGKLCLSSPRCQDAYFSIALRLKHRTLEILINSGTLGRGKSHLNPLALRSLQLRRGALAGLEGRSAPLPGAGEGPPLGPPRCWRGRADPRGCVHSCHRRPDSPFPPLARSSPPLESVILQ